MCQFGSSRWSWVRFPHELNPPVLFLESSTPGLIPCGQDLPGARITSGGAWKLDPRGSKKHKFWPSGWEKDLPALV